MLLPRTSSGKETGLNNRPKPPPSYLTIIVHSGGVCIEPMFPLLVLHPRSLTLSGLTVPEVAQSTSVLLLARKVFEGNVHGDTVAPRSSLQNSYPSTQPNCCDDDDETNGVEFSRTISQLPTHLTHAGCDYPNRLQTIPQRNENKLRVGSISLLQKHHFFGVTGELIVSLWSLQAVDGYVRL